MGVTALLALSINAQNTIRLKNPMSRTEKGLGEGSVAKTGTPNTINQVNGNLVCLTSYTANTNQDLVFKFTQTGNTDEWIDFFELTFPAGITPVSSGNATFPTASAAGGAEALNPVSGQIISWGADINDGYGGIVTTSVGVTFTVNVTVGSISGNQVANFLASGDTYTTAGNPTPGNLNGTCNIIDANSPIVNMSTNLLGVITNTATGAVAGNANCSLGLQFIAAQVKNVGNTTESNFTVNYAVNGVASMMPVTYTGSIAPGDSDIVVMLPYDFSAQGIYDVKAWTSTASDVNLANDTTLFHMANSVPVALTSSIYNNGIETDYDQTSLNLDWTGTGLPFGLSTGTKHSGTTALFYTVNMTTIGAPAGTYESFINLPCMDVTNGETYRISYWRKANTSGTLTVNGQSAILTGTSQDGASMTTVLKPYSAITPNAQAGLWQKDSVDYTATANETRYFAIGGKGTLATSNQQINVRIDDIKIEKVVLATGIKTNAIESASIFPNPNNGIFNINNVEATSSFEVYNVIGDKVFSSQLNKGNNAIDLSNLSNGSYFVKINSNNGSTTKKVVISK